MKRLDFVLKSNGEVKNTDPINFTQIKVFIDGRPESGIVCLKLKVDMTYGFVMAYVKRWKPKEGTVEQIKKIEEEVGVTNYTVEVDQSGRFIYEELNPRLQPNSLVMEKVTNNGIFTTFHLRTIGNESWIQR